MAGEYIIPLGIDGKNVLSGIDEMLNSLDKVGDKANDTGKAMKEGFEAGAKATIDVEKKLKPLGKGLEDIRDTSKKLNTDLMSSFDLKKTGAEFSKQIDDFKKQLEELTTQNKVGLEVDPKAVTDLREATDYLAKNFTDVSKILEEAGGVLQGNIMDAKDNIATMEADIKEIENLLDQMAPGKAKAETFVELGSAKDALEEETLYLKEYEEQLKQTNTANKDLAKTLADAEKAVESLTVEQIGLNSSFDEVYKDLMPMTQRLGELEDRMYELALAGKQNTAEFRELQDEAIRYRQIIQQVDNTVDTFARNSAVLDIAVEAAQGLTGAFAAVQGAAALFGEENEEIEKALLKVNAAMSLMQGVQAVAALLNKESAISALFLRTATVSQTQAIVANTVAKEGQAVATRTATIATRASTVATRAFGLALKALGIGLIIGLISYLVVNWDKLTSAVNKFLPAGESVGKIFDNIQSYAVGVGNAVFQYIITPFTAVTALLQGDLAGFKEAVLDGYSFKKNFTEGFNSQELRNEKEHLRELEEERIKAMERDLERRRNRGENVDKLEIELQKRKLANIEKESKEYEEAQKELEDLEDKNLKTRNDAVIKAGEDNKKLALEASKIRLETLAKENEQVKKYSEALEQSRIESIKDGAERERAEIDSAFQTKIDALEEETALTEEARKLQIDLEIEAVEERVRKIEELEKRTAREQIELRLDAQENLAQLSEQNLETELELLKIDHEKRLIEINEQYKEEEEIRSQLTTALTESTERERLRITQEWSDKRLKEEEEKQLLSIELASEYSKKSEETERQKQIAILETRTEFAQKYLQSLIDSGIDENSLEVMRAKDALLNLKEELEEVIKENAGKGFDLFEFLGIDVDSQQKEALMKAGKIVADSLKQVTDLMIDQYDRQIDKQQEAIDVTNDEIDDLEDRLEDEKELREDGFANNIEVIEAEIAEKKRQRDEETALQEETLKKREQLQKAMMVVDTAIQLVNMITASSNIFKILSAVPVVGIPLAITTIATMFGAFTAAKVKAFQAVSSGDQMGEGGWIDGKPHSQGGKKYYSPEGKVKELEGEEFVVRKKQAVKFSNLLEAINTGQFSGFDVNDNGLKEMLYGMGISMFEDSSLKGLEEAKKIESIKNMVTVNLPANDRELREINENIRFLARQERERKHSWEDDKYIYLKEGNRTTRILKDKSKKNDPAEE